MGLALSVPVAHGCHGQPDKSIFGRTMARRTRRLPPQMTVYQPPHIYYAFAQAHTRSYLGVCVCVWVCACVCVCVCVGVYVCAYIF